MRRIKAVLLAAWAFVGVQLMMLPPEAFGSSETEGDECVMACSLESRECCCKLLAPHSRKSHRETDSAEVQLRLPDERPCPEATSPADLLDGSGKKFVVEERGERRVALDLGLPIAAEPAIHRAGRDDPPSFPRPPPVDF